MGLWLVLFFLGFRMCAVTEEVLDGPEYYAKLMECVKGAKSSIEAALYTISLREDNSNSPTKALLEALIDAQKRGVRVSLLPEHEVCGGNFAESEEELGGGVGGRLAL